MDKPVTRELEKTMKGVGYTKSLSGDIFTKKNSVSARALLKNTKDKSTVVRWCAVYALSKIALNNLEVRDDLVNIIHGILGMEKNNGVRNVYLNAIKQLD